MGIFVANLNSRQPLKIDKNGGNLTYSFCSFDEHSEEGVRAGRRIIHCRLAHFPQTISLFHQRVNLFDRLDSENGDIFDVDSLVWVLFQVQFQVGVLPKQIPNFFLVDFDVGTAHQKLLRRILVVIDAAIDVIEGVRNDTLVLWVGVLASHGMRFAAPRLPIRKYGSIVAAQD